MFDKKEIVKIIEDINKEIEEAKALYGVNIPVELVGKQACHGGLALNSASRNQMVGGNISSSVRVNNPSRKKTMTGYEYEFSKTTWKVQAPEDMIVLSVYDSYPSLGQLNYLSPEKTIVYRSIDTGEIGCLKLPVLKKYHESFGTKLIPTDDYHKIEPRAKFEKGTVFLKSPSVDEDGFWRYGVELNGVSSSDFDGIEDGIKFYKSGCEKIAYKSYGTIKFAITEDLIPINAYGNQHEFKIFPDIGESIPDDRIIAAFRPYNEMSSMISMTPKALTRENIRFDTDKVFFLRPGETNARVHSVDVHYQANPSRPTTPRGVDQQLMKYINAKTRTSIRALTELSMFEKSKEPLHPTYHNFSVENISDINVLSESDLAANGLRFYKDIVAPKMVASSVLSEWYVTLTYECDIIPGYGQKVTGCSGNKSVITAVDEDENAYTDKDGNRADFVHDNLSVIKRTNSFAVYEPGLNSMLRDVSRYALQSIGFDRRPTTEQRRAIETCSLTDEQYKIAVGIYDEYLSCGLIMHRLLFWKDMLENPTDYKKDIAIFLLEDKQFNYLPINNPYETPMVLNMMLDKFEDIIIYDKLTFKYEGKMKETVGRVLVGSAYIMVLDKPGTDYQAVSSSPVNHYGLSAKISSGDKQKYPIRLQPTRTAGNDEEALHCKVNDSGDTALHANVRDYNDNPISHAELIRNIIKTPTENPAIGVDRNVVPMGGGVASSIAKHLLQCKGIVFKNKELDK